MKLFSKFSALTLLAFVLLIFTSCGEITPKGDLTDKTVALESIESIKLNGNYRLFYVLSSNNEIYIESYPNIINNLSIKQNKGLLTIEEKRPTDMVDFYNVTIFSPSVPKEIKVGGAVEFSISGALQGEQIKINLLENAKFMGGIDMKTTQLEMKDSSRANFSGSTQSAEIKMGDTAHLIAPYWNVNKLSLSSSEGPYIEINVKDSLKGEAKNTSKLLIYGEAVNQLKADKTVTLDRKNRN